MGFFTKSKKVNVEDIEERLVALEKENAQLKQVVAEIGQNLETVNGLIKVALFTQQQIAYDVSTIYDALKQIAGVSPKGAVDPLDEYLVKINPFGTDDDDGGLPN